MAGMAGNNELTQSISDLRTRALALLNSCEKLEHSLPHTPEQTQGGRSWPALLSHFVLVSKQLRDLNDEVNTLSLQHYVPRPTDVAADRNGVPTMFVPLLLQTKLLPEQERDQQELLDVIRSEMETEVASLQEDAHISADDMTIEDRVDALDQRVQDQKTVIEEADQMFDVARKRLMKQCAATVERYSASRVVPPPRQAIQLFRFLDSGTDRAKCK